MVETFIILSQASSIGQSFSAFNLLLLGAGIVGLTLIMRSTAKRSRESREPGSPAKQRYARMTQEVAAKRDLESVMVELDELARQIHGRIDTKFAKLESIIQDADARIATLSKLTHTPERSSALDVTVSDENTTSASTIDFPTPRVSASSTTKPAHKHAEIYRLADGGMNVVDIAAQVGRMTGEIELILSLRKTQIQANRS